MNNSKSTKTTVFNLIILDESGSMISLKPSTVSGCNELINVIRESQKQHADTQRNLLSIFAFQSGGGPHSRYIIKNEPIDSDYQLSPNDYQPCGCTPLYDAVGSTLVDLKAIAATHEDATAIVSIITDGLENSSTQYNRESVLQIIDACKELGWTINFIGSNIDEVAVSQSINIDNSLGFESSAAGVKGMWSQLSHSVNMALCDEADDSWMSVDDKIESRKTRSKNFFRK